MSLEALALESGRGIAASRSASQLDKATILITNLVTEGDNLDFLMPLVEQWPDIFDSEFMLGQAREAAVSLGANVLLFAAPEADRENDPADSAISTLSSFKIGLYQGGMGRRTPAALIGRVISEEAQERLRGTSNSAEYSPDALIGIGDAIDVFSWRERFFLETAKLGQRSGHTIPRKAGAFALRRLEV